MSLNAFRLAFKTASNTGLLPAFGWVLLIAVLLSLGTGLYGGYEWRKGRDAIADAAELRAQRKADRETIEQLKTAATELKQNAVDNAVAWRDAAQRMDGIATTLEKNLEHNQAFAREQRDELATLLARRPDLHAQPLGDDVLQHWNRSNAGPGAAVPAARPAGQPAHPVPGSSGGAKQSPRDADRQSRRSGSAVPRLPRTQPLAAAGLRRMGADRVELVVQRGAGERPRFIGMHQW